MPKCTNTKYVTGKPETSGTLAPDLINVARLNAKDGTLRQRVKLGNYYFNAIIDSGARISLISHRILKQIPYKISRGVLPLIQTISGEQFLPEMAIDVTMSLKNRKIETKLYVIYTNEFDVLLGLPLCQQAELTLHLKVPKGGNKPQKSVRVSLLRNYTIPVNTCRWLKVRAPVIEGEYLLE